MKRILINSSYGDELRVALVDGAKLYDFDTESPDKTLLKGSIFKATVSRIETSLDAAFVNFGSDRHGFLPYFSLIISIKPIIFLVPPWTAMPLFLLRTI